MAQSIKMLKAQAWQRELLPQHSHKGRLKELTPQSCFLTSTWQIQTHRYTQIYTHTLNKIKGFTDNVKSDKESMLQFGMSYPLHSRQRKRQREKNKTAMKRWGKH